MTLKDEWSLKIPFSWIRRYPDVAGLLAIGCILRVLGIGWRSLWLDEAKTLIIASAPLSKILGLIRGLEGIPPLYFLLLHFWLFCFSDPIIGLRAFSAFCGIASLPLFFILCRRILGESYRVAFFLGCFSSYWINVSQDGRTYSLFLLLSLGQSLAALSLLKRWSARRLLVYGAVSLFGLYTHIYFSFFLLAQFVYIAWQLRGDSRKLVRWASMHAAIAILFLPWMPSLRVQMSRADTRLIDQPLTFNIIAEIVGTMAFNLSLWGLVFGNATRNLGYLFIAGTAAGICFRIRRKNVAAMPPLLSFCAAHLVVPLATVRLVELILHRYIGLPRYFIFMSPYFYIILAWVLSGKSMGRIMRVVVASLVGFSAVVYFASAQIDTRLDYLAASLRRNTDSRGAIFHALDYEYLPLRYYYLSERPHYLLCPDNKNVDWKELPGYPATASTSVISHMKQCVVIDPIRRINGKIYEVESCLKLANHVCR